MIYRSVVVLLLMMFVGVGSAWALDVHIKKSDGSEVVILAEVADTPDMQSQGLMGRKSLMDEHGMLFVFKVPQMLRFWMKGTIIPLDMIFITDKGMIGNIHENAKPLDLTPIPALKPAIAVLEIGGGQAKKLGISAGDKVFYDIPVNQLEKK